MTNRIIDIELLQPLVPFKDLMPMHLQQLISECETVFLFPGDVLLEKGQYDDVHFYLLNGELEVPAMDADANSEQSCSYRESSLYPVANTQPRPCRLVARTEATVLKVARERMDQLLTWSQAAEYLLLDIARQRQLDEDAAWLSTILKSNLFLKIPPTNVERIFDQLETQLVHAGEVIVRQGELGDCCYFIKDGEAEVRRQSRPAADSELLACIGEGRCFGEDALLRETVRNASVKMLTDGVLLKLSKFNFLQLLREPRIAQLSRSDFLQRADSMIVIDVRTEGEYCQGHLGNAVNIPLNLLRLKSRMLSERNSCLVYCDTGRRSAAASYFLQRQGIAAQALAGGVCGGQQDDYKQHWNRVDYVLRDGQVVEGQ